MGLDKNNLNPYDFMTSKRTSKIPFLEEKKQGIQG